MPSVATHQAHVLVGKIVAPHGIKGQVKIVSYTADPATLFVLKDVASSAGKAFSLKAHQHKGETFVVTIAGVTDRNAAETLVGTELYVARESLPAPEAGEYFHADLIGLTVTGAEAVVLGTVTAVYNFGAGDVLEITHDGDRQTLYPFDHHSVLKVDINAGRIIIDAAIFSQLL